MIKIINKPYFLNVFKRILFILTVAFLNITYLYSWGSLKTGEAFSTHLFINKQAYSQLEEHPAFAYVDFPTLEDIQNYASVQLNYKFGKYGLGPDVDGNSKFSEHWYNPKNKEGNAPTSAEKYHDLLRRALMRPKGTYNEKQARQQKAKVAAYASHYIQDVTCPMHVTGMSGKNVDPNIVGSKNDISPLVGNYTSGQWKILVRRFKTAQAEADSKRKTRGTMDYFDPLYFDANYNNPDSLYFDIKASELGSHFQYEMQVELKYKTDVLSWAEKWKDVEDKGKGYIHPKYLNTKSIATLAKEVASKTYESIGTEKNPGKLWIDIGKENKAYVLPSMNSILNIGGNRSNRDAIYNSLQIPYTSWWKAIQLTYVSWRSTFSALHIAKKNIKFVKVPNKESQYQLYVAVFNYEPESKVIDVKVKVKITGDIKLNTTAKKAQNTIPKGSGIGSGWFKVGSPLTIKNPNNLNGKIELTITGTYDENIPDSGEKVVEYNIQDISIEALSMPDMIGSSKDWAKKNLEDAPYNFKVNIQSAGKSSIGTQGNTVKSQIPEVGALVGIGEDVSLDVYDEFKDELMNNCKDKFSTELENIKKEIISMKDFSDGVQGNCAEIKKLLDNQQKQITLEKNIFSKIKAQINDLVEKMKNTEKDKEIIEDNDKKIEKLATEIEKILTDLGELSLKICKKTKTLNNNKIDNSEHKKSSRWIQNNKKELKFYLEQVKQLHEKIESYKDKIISIIKKIENIEKKDLDSIADSIEKMNSVSKNIDITVAQVENIFTDNLKNVSIIDSRNLAVKRSLKSLSKECEKELKDEISKLLIKLSNIELSSCSKGVKTQINNLKTTSVKIKKDAKNSAKEAIGITKELKEYTKNIEMIKSLEKDRKMTLLLVNSYLLNAKRFAVDGALCVVLSEEIMDTDTKVLDQIVYRIEGGGFTPHYGRGSYEKVGYRDVLFTLKEPATEGYLKSIIEKVYARFKTDPCETHIPVTPGYKMHPSIWKNGPKVTIIRGPASGLSSELSKNGWKIIRSDGPTFSELKEAAGCKK